jgi:uncharacterized protein YjbI with pentapeptide repeats
VSLWPIIIFGLVVLGLAVASGLYFFWPSRTERVSRSDLGVALFSGVLVAGSILVIQVLFDLRLNQIETNREDSALRAEARETREAQRQEFQMLVGLEEDLTGIRPPTRDLSGFYLRNKTLNEADLRAADLTDADLTDSRLRRAHLEDAVLTRTKLQRAKLIEAFMRGAKLRDADLTFAELYGAGLKDVVMIGGFLEEADLRYAQLQRATIRNVTLTLADFTGAHLEGTDFTGSEGSEVTFTQAFYDSETVWPRRYERRCDPGRICIVTADEPPQR